MRFRALPLLLAFTAITTLAAVGAAPARAENDLGLQVDTVEVSSGAVLVSYRVEKPFTPRLEETLLQGMPATIVYEVGLWKRRVFWFDKLIVAMKNEHRVMYDPWRDRFRVRSGVGIEARTRSFPSIDSLEATLFDVRRLPVSLLTALEPEGSYYVTVRVLIRPLAEEDLGEVEDWLAGEGKEPDGSQRGLPRYLFGITANLSGLGDRTAVARSAHFTPARRFAAAGVR
ncbi:MAG TPA: DUF4390 domain-containing protein [Candidatus Binatia bacterium]|nr:DUF4390 domain-containing protein [Candidatus Binatia bacterium]